VTGDRHSLRVRRGAPGAGVRAGHESLPLGQFVARAGIIDLGWGHPDPALLPIEAIQLAAARVLERYGAGALTYGHAAGPGPFLEWVAERLGEVDARAPDPGAIVATAGNSHALDQVVSMLTSPGDVVLVEDPTYHLASRILRDHPVELVAVPADEQGLRTDALAEALEALRPTARRPRLLYTVPTFHNPTGVSLTSERRRALVDLATGAGLTIVEDDAYRELSYEGPPPASLWSLAPDGVVVRLVSFSKSLAPGLRAGCIVSDSATTQRFVTSGVLDSGGGISHFSCLLVAECGRSGTYTENVGRLRAAYRQRRDALVDALTVAVGHRGAWTVPGGGYFVWITLEDVVRATDLLRRAESHGTSFVPGEVFHLDRISGRSSLRLGFTLYSPAMLVEAGARLGRALAEV
jgi:2-aminoadipate transaminase